MSLQDDIALLAQVELFSALPSEQLRLLAFGCESLQMRAGRLLFREGQPADCGYVVGSGQIRLTRSVGGDDIEVKTVGVGGLLGELALITNTERAVTAEAIETASVLRINRSLFRRVLEEHPESAAQLHARLTERLNAFLKDIGALEARFAR